MVDHINLDNNYIQHTLPKGTISGSLLITLYDSDCVHIYVNKLIKFHKEQGVGLKPFKMIYFTHIRH
jgi:hypothetical protein